MSCRVGRPETDERDAVPRPDLPTGSVDSHVLVGQSALVTDRDRLQQEAPRLAALVDVWPDEDRVRVVWQVVERVAELKGVANDCRAAGDITELVAQLDEKAWDLQQRGASSEYARAFARARAANAWLLLSSGESLTACHDAIYESLHALDASTAEIVALFDS